MLCPSGSNLSCSSPFCPGSGGRLSQSVGKVMANYSPQQRTESPGGPSHWQQQQSQQQSVNHLQTSESSIQYTRNQNDSGSSNTNGTTNGTSFQRQEQPGTVITYVELQPLKLNIYTIR